MPNFMDEMFNRFLTDNETPETIKPTPETIKPPAEIDLDIVLPYHCYHCGSKNIWLAGIDGSVKFQKPFGMEHPIKVLLYLCDDCGWGSRYCINETKNVLVGSSMWDAEYGEWMI